LWGQKNLAFRADFLATIRNLYGAGVQEVGFRDDPEGARKVINDWVQKQTAERIKDLVPPGGLTKRSRLVLTNAVYFKAEWRHPFNKFGTRAQPFLLASGEKVQVPTMSDEAEFGYLDGDTVQALELPYKGRELSMVVLLPKEANGLAEL